MQAANCEPDSTSRTSLPPVAATARRARALVRQVFQALCVTALALASYFLISHFLLQSVKVVGKSMLPTLGDSHRYLLNRWVYYVRAPRPHDVVVLCDPTDHGFSVKRVVAASGDSVYLKEGSVYVNGRKLDEPYLLPGTPTLPVSNLKEQLFKCGRDQYFVLGDNRNNSIDSRTYGPISRRSILGMVIQ